MTAVDAPIVVPVKADIDKFKKDFAKVQKHIKNVNKDLKAQFKASAVAFTGLTAGLGASLVSFAKFENELNSVKTLLNEDSFKNSGKNLEQGFKDMRKELMAVGATTPVAIGDLNKALFDTVSAGVDAGKAVDVVRSAAGLAVAGVTDLKVATDGITSALNAYGMGAEQSELVASKFFQAQVNGKLTIEELSSSIGTLAPTAAAMGVSFDEMLGSVSAITLAGTSTSEAMTQMKAVLSNIAKPTKAAQEEAARLGIQFDQSALKTKGLQGFIESLTNAQGFNKESATKLFGSTEALNAIFSLTGNQADAFKKTIGSLGNEQKTLTNYQKQLASQSSTLHNQIEILKNKFSVLVQTLVSEFAPIATKVIKVVSQLFTKISQDEKLRKLVVGVLAGSAALTGLVTAMGAVGFAAKILMGGSGIGLIIIGLGLLYSYWDDIWPAMKKTFFNFVDYIKLLANSYLKILKGMFTFDFALIKEGLGDILDYWSDLFIKMEEKFSNFVDSTKGLASALGKIMKGAFTFDFDQMKEGMNDLLEQLKEKMDLSEEKAVTRREKAKTKKDEENKEDLEKEKNHQKQKKEIVLAGWQQEAAAKKTLQAEMKASDIAAMDESISSIKDSLGAKATLSQAEVELVANKQKTEDQISREFRAKKIEQEIEFHNKILEDKEKYGAFYAKLNSVTHTNVYKGTKSALGELTSLQNSSSKKLKAVGKASSIAMTIMNTYESAMNVFKGFSTIPFVGAALGTAAAAAVVAGGMLRVAEIRKANKGAYVSGGMRGVDDQLFMLGKHEIVTPAISYDEHINAVVNQRMNRTDVENVEQEDNVKNVKVQIGFKGDASKYLTAKVNEDRAIGVVGGVL